MASCSASLQLPAVPQPGISRSSAAAVSRRLSQFNTCRQWKYRFVYNYSCYVLIWCIIINLLLKFWCIIITNHYYYYRPHSTKLFAGPAYFPPTSYTDDYCRDLHTESHYKPEGSTRNNPHPTKVSESNTSRLIKLIIALFSSIYHDINNNGESAVGIYGISSE